ncbi:exo-alpha-sialidase [Paenibacillus mendelii]|uniref:Exo-alpha-sialidase n=1 Tax=Paenibacillus mendelii TaxID=206163 RepID=A0ABV6JB45_9BACL|nr:exo-alpha-sialidase [Paenibacillus mendelii]MCQ6562989.1 exo-alpha-sialidase [Paenibacillus mendelii]
MQQSEMDRPWNFLRASELYNFAGSEEAAGTELHITRLAPGDGRVELDWQYQGDMSSLEGGGLAYRISYGLRGNGEKTVVAHNSRMPHAIIEGLENGVDYELTVTAVRAATDEPVAESALRLFCAGPVPGTVINYIHPEDYAYGFSGRSPASPSIVELPDGRLVASHDVYWGNAGQNLSKVFRSEDNGETWTFIADLYPCFWGKLFVHQERLYMLATSTEYGDLLIGRSDDGGETWSAPTCLIEGGSRETGGPHKSSMPVTIHNGRLWTAIDYGSWHIKGRHASGVISASVDSNLLDAASWIATPFLPYDSSWEGAVKGGIRTNLLEGNVVKMPDNRLVSLLRYECYGASEEFGKAIYLEIDPALPEASPSFGKVIDFPNNNSKFSVYYDAPSGLYWSLVNRYVAHVGQRNVLSLVCSPDMEQWQVVKDILDYERNDWPEDYTKVGFQYVDWFVKGEDLLFASRTAINGAANYHNANYLTFHRIVKFRSLTNQQPSDLRPLAKKES